MSTNHKPFEEKGLPKRIRTEVLPLTTSLTLYRWAKPALKTFATTTVATTDHEEKKKERKKSTRSERGVCKSQQDRDRFPEPGVKANG